MATLLIHTPSRRRCKPVPMGRDAGRPGGLHLADGLVMVEWLPRFHGEEIRAMTAVPASELSPLTGQSGPPDAHLSILRPLVADRD